MLSTKVILWSESACVLASSSTYLDISSCSLQRLWSKSKQFSRLVLLKRAQLYHSTRVYFNAMFRKRSALDDALILDLVEFSLSPYTRIRRYVRTVIFYHFVLMVWLDTVKPFYWLWRNIMFARLAFACLVFFVRWLKIPIRTEWRGLFMFCLPRVQLAMQSEIDSMLKSISYLYWSVNIKKRFLSRHCNGSDYLTKILA